MKLSILIPTTPDRKLQTEKLVKELKRQIVSCKAKLNSHVQVFEDNKEMSIGAKRQMMYENAPGLYSWQIDSDDWIHPNAIEMILKAIEEEKDCITFKELYILNGKKAFVNNFSLIYDDWKDGCDGFDYVRTPFFKTPIKTELCKQAGVKDMRFAEDHDFARRIKPLLKSETHIDEFIYWYLPFATEHKERYGINSCMIVNAGIDAWYPVGSQRLRSSLQFHGYSGSSLIYETLPPFAPTHKENPYAFKIFAIEEALKFSNITTVLWCDSSVYPVKNPMPVFDSIVENGMFLFKTGYNVAQTATDSVLEYAGLTRDEAEQIPEYASGCVGFNIGNDKAKNVWLTWRQYMIDGQFKNSRQHDNQSTDPRFLFGRQDQTALSLACHKHGVNLPQSDMIAYYGQNYDKEKLIFFIQGL